MVCGVPFCFSAGKEEEKNEEEEEEENGEIRGKPVGDTRAMEVS